MNEFTASYLAELTASLSEKLLSGAGKKLRDAISGTEKERAIGRCVEKGLAALLVKANTANAEERDLLATIFQIFFAQPDVGRELGALLKGQWPNREELLYLFNDAGFEASRLPGVSFDAALDAFAAMFLLAAMEEPALQGAIQTNQLLTQTHLQRALLEEMRGLAQFLRTAPTPTLQIQNGQISAQPQAGGERIVFRAREVSVSGDVVGRDKTEIHAQTYIENAVIGETAADWEGHYLRMLIRECEALDLTLIDETAVEASAVSVSEVFTTLYLARLTRSPEQKIAAAILKPHEPDMQQKTEREEKRLPIPAVEAVAAMPRLVILGQPGGGKSTLVNHLVAQLAQRRLGKTGATDKLPEWPPEEKPLPVRIVLRRFAAAIPPETKRGGAGLVWDYLEQQLKECGCKEFFQLLKQRLTEEAGAVFFDGLDEVHETDAEMKRSLITQAIAEFAAPLAQCRVIVTCREYAYRQSKAWQLPKKDFPDVELDLFGEEQIEHFTKTWYQIVGPEKGWSMEKCRDEAKNLFQAIHEWPHLRELGQYPLLLTLMAQVHGRDGTLPNDRADLYERAVNLLLAHWQNRLVRDVSGNRKLEPGLIMQLGVRTETLRAILERVAFAAHERQEKMPGRSADAADIPKEDLREELENALGNAEKAKQVLAYIQERAGLLQAHDQRTYRFPHRTFQEYLAATHLLKQGEFDAMLHDRMKRDLIWWREVFLLAAGASRSTPRNISDLVDGLVPRVPETLTSDHAAQLQAAGQALAETNFIAHVRGEKEPGRFAGTYERIQNGLLRAMRSDQTLPATERAGSGNVLSRLGDRRAEVMTIADMQFCLVPAGPFWMGSEEDDDEKPLHLNEALKDDYWMSRYPVSNAQFAEFIKAGGYREARYWPEAIAEKFWQNGKFKGRYDSAFREQPDDHGAPFNFGNHPVVGITWYEALAFARWLNEFGQNQNWLGANVRVQLPSEAEWEKAGRGGLEIPPDFIIMSLRDFSAKKLASLQKNVHFQRRYPWGDPADSNFANYSDTGIGATSAVGCFPGGASPYGCEEMSGNVWEWTRSLYDAYPYPADEKEKAARENLSAPQDAPRVFRGGAFYNDNSGVRCGSRGWNDPDLRHRHHGFRVVVAPIKLLKL